MSNRAERLVERLPEIGADLIVVTSLVNVRYLTGYTGSNGVAVVGPSLRLFLTDFRYTEQSAVEVDSTFDRKIATLDLLEGIADALPSGELRLAFEDGHLTVRSHARLRELMPERVELVAAGDQRLVLRLEAAGIRAGGDLAGHVAPGKLWLFPA